MSQPKQKSISRLAVDHLKEQYLLGTIFYSSRTIRDALQASGVECHTRAEAGRWALKARNELLRKGIVVPPPVAELAYETNAYADMKTLLTALVASTKHTVTRLRNDLARARVAAERDDATRDVIVLAAQLEMALASAEVTLSHMVANGAETTQEI